MTTCPSPSSTGGPRARGGRRAQARGRRRRHRAGARRALRRPRAGARRRAHRARHGDRSSSSATSPTRPPRRRSSTRCDARFGAVHGLVNVAAKTSRATLFTDTPEHFDQMMTVNVKAPYFLIQAAARLMIRDRRARLDRQHRLDLAVRRPDQAHRVRDVEGRARGDDEEPRVRPHASRHPGQPGQPRLDGHRVRARHAGHLRRRSRELARAGRGPARRWAGWSSRGRSPT